MGSIYRIIGWIVPLLCVAAAAGVLYNRQSELKATDGKQKAAEVQYQNVINQKSAVLSEPQDRRFAAAKANPFEETRFLDELRKRALLTGTTITSWAASSATFGPREQSSLTSVPFTEEEAKSISGVTRITCDLKLRGDYQALRAFIHAVSDEDRLLTLNKVTWSRGTAGSELNLSISRYTIVTADSNPAGKTTEKATQKATDKPVTP